MCCWRAGKERRLGLIKEIRDAEPEPDSAQAQIDAAEDAELEAQRHGTDAATAAVGHVQGEVMGATLDFLAKELVRMTEFSRISALGSRAEETRRSREAAEGGRRQAEELLRAKQDNTYRQLMRVHNQAASTFTDQLLQGVVDEVSLEDAAMELNIKRDLLAPSIAALEGSSNTDQAVVKDLVASFLVPEVQRERVRDQINQKQQKYKTAAAEAVASATPRE